MILDSQKNALIEQLRGVAILLVLIFHYVNRIPHDILGSATPPSVEFFTGKIGVYLFFILSGFLIAKTIGTCSTLGEFYAKRLSRIWPLFILANVFVFGWVLLFETPVVPEGVKDFDVQGRTVMDLIGTSFFLKDLGFQWIDGVHWSILVELKFYLFVGLFTYFFKKKAIDAFSIFAVFFGLLDFAILTFVGDGTPMLINKLLHGVLIAQYLPLFAIGMMLYHRKYNLLIACSFFLALAQLVESAALNPDFTVVGTLEFTTLTVAFLFLDWGLFKGRICTFFGKYSYSIYLFHQVVGLSIIMAITPMIGIDMAILLATAFVIPLSVAASHLVEWRYRRKVTTLLIKAGSFIGLQKLSLDPFVAKEEKTQEQQYAESRT